MIAAAEFKLKYADSALGYVWSVVKPLAIFSVLYFVFGRFFALEVGFVNYPLYLLIGIVLWTFFADATSLALTSIVARGPLLTKLSFPRIVIPLAVTLTTAITFAVNLVVVVGFVVFADIALTWSWLLIPLLLVELYVFTLGVSLVIAALFVRLRDLRQVWELVIQLLFFASPILYPVYFLPPWAQPIAFCSPFVQVMQDARAIVLSEPLAVTANDIIGAPLGRLAPIGVAVGVLALGLWYFRREERWFAERV